MLLTVLLRLTLCAGWRQPCATCPGTTIAPCGPSPWPPPPGPPPPPGGGPHQHPLRVALRAASAAIANSFFILPPSMDLRSRGAAACKRNCDVACQWGSYQSTKDHVLRSRYNPRLKDAALYGAHGGQNARCMGHAWRFQCSGEGRSRVHALFGYGSWCKEIFSAKPADRLKGHRPSYLTAISLTSTVCPNTRNGKRGRVRRLPARYRRAGRLRSSVWRVKLEIAIHCVGWSAFWVEG